MPESPFLLSAAQSPRKTRAKLLLANKRFFAYNIFCSISPAGVMELVDVADSKSAAGDSVPVRVRSPAPKRNGLLCRPFLFSYLYCQRLPPKPPRPPPNPPLRPPPKPPPRLPPKPPKLPPPPNPPPRPPPKPPKLPPLPKPPPRPVLPKPPKELPEPEGRLGGWGGRRLPPELPPPYGGRGPPCGGLGPPCGGRGPPLLGGRGPRGGLRPQKIG